ncbi:hypothetical protein L596_021364 [Steinernema carpocapsae]|uniref:Uncharacterized protein n=1 Tax=Steinernema carpocapsae TaxID=34508 RepID=A0A4U5MIH4_STECR|nr:hypothetical protein L596_021364 [Steinernema carpocapsae]
MNPKNNFKYSGSVEIVLGMFIIALNSYVISQYFVKYRFSGQHFNMLFLKAAFDIMYASTNIVYLTFVLLNIFADSFANVILLQAYWIHSNNCKKLIESNKLKANSPESISVTPFGL